jgi:hypothetical protein
MIPALGVGDLESYDAATALCPERCVHAVRAAQRPAGFGSVTRSRGPGRTRRGSVSPLGVLAMFGLCWATDAGGHGVSGWWIGRVISTSGGSGNG